jgi:hypothetical protein
VDLELKSKISQEKISKLSEECAILESACEASEADRSRAEADLVRSETDRIEKERLDAERRSQRRQRRVQQALARQQGVGGAMPYSDSQLPMPHHRQHMSTDGSALIATRRSGEAGSAAARSDPTLRSEAGLRRRGSHSGASSRGDAPSSGPPRDLKHLKGEVALDILAVSNEITAEDYAVLTASLAGRTEAAIAAATMQHPSWDSSSSSEDGDQHTAASTTVGRRSNLGKHRDENGEGSEHGGHAGGGKDRDDDADDDDDDDEDDGNDDDDDDDEEEEDDDDDGDDDRNSSRRRVGAVSAKKIPSSYQLPKAVSAMPIIAAAAASTASATAGAGNPRPANQAQTSSLSEAHSTDLGQLQFPAAAAHKQLRKGSLAPNVSGALQMLRGITTQHRSRSDSAASSSVLVLDTDVPQHQFLAPAVDGGGHRSRRVVGPGIANTIFARAGASSDGSAALGRDAPAGESVPQISSTVAETGVIGTQDLLRLLASDARGRRAPGLGGMGGMRSGERLDLAALVPRVVFRAAELRAYGRVSDEVLLDETLEAHRASLEAYANRFHRTMEGLRESYAEVIAKLSRSVDQAKALITDQTDFSAEDRLLVQIKMSRLRAAVAQLDGEARVMTSLMSSAQAAALQRYDKGFAKGGSSSSKHNSSSSGMLRLSRSSSPSSGPDSPQGSAENLLDPALTGGGGGGGGGGNRGPFGGGNSGSLDPSGFFSRKGVKGDMVAAAGKATADLATAELAAASLQSPGLSRRVGRPAPIDISAGLVVSRAPVALPDSPRRGSLTSTGKR